MLFYRAALPLSSRTLNYAAGVIRRHRTPIRAFAVVRLDLAHLELEPELAVKVVEVLPDEDSAVDEADRRIG